MSTVATRVGWILEALKILDRGYPGGWWTKRQIADALVYFEPCERTLLYHLQSLEAAGSIEVKHSPGRSPNVYRIRNGV